MDRIITLMLDRKMLMRWKSPTVNRADKISDRRTFSEYMFCHQPKREVAQFSSRAFSTLDSQTSLNCSVGSFSLKRRMFEEGMGNQRHAVLGGDKPRGSSLCSLVPCILGQEKKTPWKFLSEEKGW